MSTINPETMTLPSTLEPWTDTVPEVSEILERVARVAFTAEDRAVITLKTGVTLLVEERDDAEAHDVTFVRVTVREDDHETILRDGSRDSDSSSHVWRGFVFAAIRRYDEYLARRQGLTVEANNIRRDVLCALQGLVDRGVIDTPYDHDVVVRLTEQTTLEKISVVVIGSPQDDRVADDAITIRQRLSRVLASYGIAVEDESQLAITFRDSTKP